MDNYLDNEVNGYLQKALEGIGIIIFFPFFFLYSFFLIFSFIRNQKIVALILFSHHQPQDISNWTTYHSMRVSREQSLPSASPLGRYSKSQKERRTSLVHWMPIKIWHKSVKVKFICHAYIQINHSLFNFVLIFNF